MGKKERRKKRKREAARAAAEARNRRIEGIGRLLVVVFLVMFGLGGLLLDTRYAGTGAWMMGLSLLVLCLYAFIGSKGQRDVASDFDYSVDVDLSSGNSGHSVSGSFGSASGGGGHSSGGGAGRGR